MRSSTPSPRSPQAEPLHDAHGVSPDQLEALARTLDEASTHERGALLIHVRPVDDELELGLRSLPPGEHPFPALAGMVAPEEWVVFGVRALGRARSLDHPSRPPQRTASTVLVDRSGREVSVLRIGRDVQVLHDGAQGTIPDACRRVLGVPTAPPPPSTSVLWTLSWLDRLLDDWGTPSLRRRITSSWEEIARRHPAVGQLPDGADVRLHEPTALVPIARTHAERWPWGRLREQPEVLQLPGDNLPAEVTRWMDDGFFARWAIGSFPSPPVLATDLPAMLGEPLGPQLARTAVDLLDGAAELPPPSR